MQFDTIKVSSFYRDHGVLGRKSIKNRKYWVQTVPFCIRNKNTVVSNGIRKYFKSQLLNCPFYQFIRPFYHKIFFLGLDGFSNLNEFQFEGNWRFYIIYIVYFSSLRFPTKTSSSHTYIVIITTFTFDNILTVDKKKSPYPSQISFWRWVQRIHLSKSKPRHSEVSWTNWRIPIIHINQSWYLTIIDISNTLTNIL